GVLSLQLPDPNSNPAQDTQQYVQVADTDKVQLLLDRANDFRSVQTLAICGTPLWGVHVADELQAKTCTTSVACSTRPTKLTLIAPSTGFAEATPRSSWSCRRS
ncbi:hypothetical protein BGZ52_001307, partial [Haplosporangium bisporale]